MSNKASSLWREPAVYLPTVVFLVFFGAFLCIEVSMRAAHGPVDVEQWDTLARWVYFLLYR